MNMWCDGRIVIMEGQKDGAKGQHEGDRGHRQVGSGRMGGEGVYTAG